MATARTDDGVDLYCEETRQGVPIAFVHELTGDMASWEYQVRHFGKLNRLLNDVLAHADSASWPRHEWDAGGDSITGMSSQASGARQ
jgi:hypothetical protein